MQLPKHGVVRAIFAFSLIGLFTIYFAFSAPPTRAASIFVGDCSARLEKLQAEAEEKRGARDALKSRLSGMRYQLPALEDTLDRMAAEILEYEEEIRLLCAEMELLDRAEGATVGVSVWPVTGYGTITCDFGNGHRGIDISGGGINGKPILAAASGVVTHSAWLNSYGYCVFIDHGNGLSTRYAHASKLACRVGDTVRAGETIAYIGSTGNSTGPHLHFEILQDGVLQNPLDYY